MDKLEINEIISKVEAVTLLLVNESLDGVKALVDFAYPNHDGMQNADAVSDLMGLRVALKQAVEISELWIKHATEAIGDELELEVQSLGLNYRINDDKTIDVKYNRGEYFHSEMDSMNTVRIREDLSNYYLDLNTGLGESIYPKKDWTFKKAFYDVIEV